MEVSVELLRLFKGISTLKQDFVTVNLGMTQLPFDWPFEWRAKNYKFSPDSRIRNLVEYHFSRSKNQPRFYV